MKEHTLAISYIYTLYVSYKSHLQISVRIVNLSTLQTHLKYCKFNCKIHFSIHNVMKIKPKTKHLH